MNESSTVFDRKDIRVVDVEEPQIERDNQVKIAVKYAGICGSDLHEYLGGPIFIPADAPHPHSGVQAPLTMGHEFSGEIVEVGSAVDSVKVGDPVTVEPILAKDGLKGDYNLDPNLGFVGLASHGGFTEFCVVDEDQVHILPEGIDFEQGALTEPAAVALYSVRQSAIKAGDTAAVFGAGPIGLLTIEALKAAGATEIYAVELSKERQEKAEHLGAIVVDPNEGDPVAKIKELAGGSLDVSFEVTGVPAVLQQSLDVVKSGGECVVVSIWEGGAEFQPNELVIREKTMKGIIAYRHIFPQVLKLMKQGYFKKEDYVTSHIKVEEIVEKGFEALANERSQIKIMVQPK